MLVNQSSTVRLRGVQLFGRTNQNIEGASGLKKQR